MVKKNFYFYDFTDLSSKKIIEFNGDYWHGNPEKYKAEELIKYPGKGEILIEELWIQDKKKNDFAKSKGFEVLIIWESEFTENREDTILKCLHFLGDRS